MSAKIKNIKSYVHYFGSTLAVCSIIFVFWRLNQYWHSVNFNNLSLSTWSLIGFLCVFYGAANLFLVQAWCSILKYYNITSKFTWIIYAYGVSQLGKYIPGNIFHIAGRQAIAMMAGMPGKSVLKSNIVELIIISCTGTLATWLILNLIIPQFTAGEGLLLLTISVLIAVFFLWRFLGPNICQAMIFHLMFLIFSASIFVIILKQLDKISTSDFSMMLSIGGVYIIAWLAGLIMPGAPAGIGIREFVVVFFLSRFIPEKDLLLSVLLGRIVTVMGDILFFIFSYFIGKNAHIKNG